MRSIRCWTLQELLTPDAVVFLESGWIENGTEFDLASIISDGTGIESKFLHDFNMACIAQKMSWASTCQTLREEDMAYCSLGMNLRPQS